MAIVICLVGIILFNLFRYLVHDTRTDRSYIIISMVIQSIPLSVGKTIYSFLEGQTVDDGSNEILGAFSNNIRVESELLFILLLLLVGYTKFKRKQFKLKNNTYLLVLLLLSVVSIFNPANQVPFSFLPLLSIVLQCWLLLKIISSNIDKTAIFKGFYDAFSLITIVQLLLTVCYPILGMESVATLFRGDHSLTLSQRRDMASAIGTFAHPGHLALFSMILLTFFTSTFLNNYKRRHSSLQILSNLFIIYFTYSRTSYLVAILVVLILYINHQNIKFFTVKNILLLLILVSISVLGIYLSPLSEMFLGSDFAVQFMNRFNHIQAGIDIWNDSKIIGVGLNSHVTYMLTHLINIYDVSDNDFLFFSRSPIHNIHIIVLAETGIIGVFTWIYFFKSNLSLASDNRETNDLSIRIMNTTCMGTLMVIIAYGCTGFAPFYVPIFKLMIFILYFTRTSFQKER